MPGTLVFDYPSVRAVTEYLAAQLLKQQAAAAQSGSPADAGATSTDVSEDGEAAFPSGSELSGAAWAPRQRSLAILAAVAQPLMAQALSPAADKVRACCCAQRHGV